MHQANVAEWKWFGHPGHFICGDQCIFHLCTLVGGGKYLVSTVGELWFDSQVRKIVADSRGIKIEGKGDDWDADYLVKVGYEDVGCGRKYETMVFKVTGEVCTSTDCNCGLPKIVPMELDSAAANQASEATQNHYELCTKWDDPTTQEAQEE